MINFTSNLLSTIFNLIEINQYSSLNLKNLIVFFGIFVKGVDIDGFW